MCNRTSFDILLDFGSLAGEFLLDWSDIDTLQMNQEELVSARLLRKRTIGSTVRCRGCDSSIPVVARERGNGIVLYGDCRECGFYELLPEEQVLWKIDYTPLFEVARKALSCSGEIAEIVPNALWNLGRAPLAGQSREIFACAGINTDRNEEIIRHLPDGKTPILLVLGNSAKPEKLGSFSSDRVFKFSHLASLEAGRIVFDKSHILSQIKTISALEPPPVKAPGKNSKIADLAVKLKQTLKEHMKGVYSAMLQAERCNKDYVFPELRQSDLAKMYDVPRVYIKRAIDNDLELRTLLESANHRDSTMAYGARARF